MAGQQYVTRSGGLTKPSERRRYRDALAGGAGSRRPHAAPRTKRAWPPRAEL
jgi:hypothetical protein